jgi:hypothetical protein
MQKLKGIALAATLASAFILPPTMLRSQSSPQNEMPSVQTVTKAPNATGIDLNRSNVGINDSSTTLSETYLNFQKGRSVWIMEGQNYDTKMLYNSSDISVKYVDSKNLLHVTLRDDRDTSGKFQISYGADTEAYINRSATLLGDLSKLRVNGNSYIDFGVGPQIKFNKNNSVFFIYSNRQQTNNSRLGYLFDGSESLFSIFMDYKQHNKPVWTGFISINDYRRSYVSYDPNSRALSTANLLSFGNTPLPTYVMTGILKQQYILTNHSVLDSDNTVIPPSIIFVDPKHKIADVLRVHLSATVSPNTIPGALVDNALMINTSKRGGILFTQTLNKSQSAMSPALSNTFYGAGGGYKFKGSQIAIAVGVQSQGCTFTLTKTF